MTPTPTVQFASFAYGGDPTGNDPAEDYHESSKLYPSFAGRQMRGASLAEQPAVLESMQRSSRRHPHRPRVTLPPPSPAGSLAEVVAARRSRCPSEGSTLDLTDVATIVSAYEADAITGRRSVPSGGALYPLELYLLATRVEGLAVGVYHFDPFDRVLSLLDPHEPATRDALVDPAIAERSAAIVVLTGLFRRTRCKYGLRGYRFALLEAGHLMQNLLLLATAANLDALPLGGFYDVALDRLVRADGVNESVVYAAALGRAPR